MCQGSPVGSKKVKTFGKVQNFVNFVNFSTCSINFLHNGSPSKLPFLLYQCEAQHNTLFFETSGMGHILYPKNKDMITLWTSETEEPSQV